MDDIYFEDVIVGAVLQAGPYVIPEQEMMAFAAAWDPLPMHVDRAYAAKHHGGLTAPGIYLLAVKLKPCPYAAVPTNGHCFNRL